VIEWNETTDVNIESYDCFDSSYFPHFDPNSIYDGAMRIYDWSTTCVTCENDGTYETDATCFQSTCLTWIDWTCLPRIPCLQQFHEDPVYPSLHQTTKIQRHLSLPRQTPLRRIETDVISVSYSCYGVIHWRLPLPSLFGVFSLGVYLWQQTPHFGHLYYELTENPNLCDGRWTSGYHLILQSAIYYLRHFLMAEYYLELPRRVLILVI
jgi:hypothetical protein